MAKKLRGAPLAFQCSGVLKFSAIWLLSSGDEGTAAHTHMQRAEMDWVARIFEPNELFTVSRAQ
jgi:hypothetical protein